MDFLEGWQIFQQQFWLKRRIAASMSVPSEAEVDAARAILDAAGNKEKAKQIKKNITAKFHYYFNNVCDNQEEKAKALGSRGDARHTMLVDFLAKGLGAKSGTQKTSFVVSHNEEVEEEEEEFSVEQLEGELGERRAAKLIDAKVFGAPNPCQYTGKLDDPDLVTYTFTRKKLRKLTGEKNSSVIAGAEGEATAEDLKALKGLKQLGGDKASSSKGADPIPIKTEVKSDEDIMEEKIKEVTDKPQASLRWVQDVAAEEERVLALAKQDPMAVTLVKGLKQNQARLEKTTELLQKLNRGDKLKNKDAMKQLVLLMDQLKNASAHNHAWAVTFGHASRKKARR